MVTKKLDKILPDTSAIINEIISNALADKKLAFKEIIIHKAIMAELENQANKRRDIGFIGINEVKKLKELSKKHKFKLTFSGQRPSVDEIKFARGGAIDALIRGAAEVLGATLITSDLVQAEIGKAIDMPVLYFHSGISEEDLEFVKYFKPNYMSVHLKEGEVAKAKAGEPGSWKFIEISKTKLKTKELKELSKQIVEAARCLDDCFLEIERKGSIIAQIKDYRIVVTRPPFSDAWEITLVRPVKQLGLEDYKLSAKMKQRLRSRAEGVLIAGAPGHGKSTFGASLVKDYASQNLVVKAIEAPRDLQLPSSITQLAISHSSSKEIHDVLLLTRPDYTIFDEIRNMEDFRLFADMRLSGVGMIGVVHATNPIDSIQRFIGKIELGMIPSIIDTVIFIREGKVSKIYSLSIRVKVPSGMTEDDLARPVVDIHDFDTGKLEYEIYTYGDATVVIPVEEVNSSQQENRELRYRLRETKKYFLFFFQTPARKVEVIVDGLVEASLPLLKGRELKIFKKSRLGKVLLDALRERKEIRFE